MGAGASAPLSKGSRASCGSCESKRSYPHVMLADAVAREGILLAARELVVLFVVVVFFAWVGYRFVRESHR